MLGFLNKLTRVSMYVIDPLVFYAFLNNVFPVRRKGGGVQSPDNLYGLSNSRLSGLNRCLIPEYGRLYQLFSWTSTFSHHMALQAV